MKKLCLLVFIGFILNVVHAHNIDYGKVILKKWELTKDHTILEGSLYMYKDGEVYIEDAQNNIGHYPLNSLSISDQEYVKKRYEKIARINTQFQNTQKEAFSLSDIFDAKFWSITILLLLLGAYIFIYVEKAKRKFLQPILFLGSVFFLFGFVNNKIRKPSATITNPLFMDSAFTLFKPKIHTSWDNTYFYVESKGIPDHEMMIGITAWQQQVPTPQCYTIANNNNMWSIPLNPVIAATPVPVNTQHFLRGAIAIAVNGVPIFNPFTNVGVDAYLAGQLDNYGGHCGRADDYHYHIAPLHLYGQVAATMPVAFAFDGFAVYGSKEPDGTNMTTLDANHGHYWTNGVYHYHGSASAPYMIGSMVGQITEDNTLQIVPQAAAQPIRTSLTPLTGATITSCLANTGNNGYNLTYTISNQTYHVNYNWTDTSNSRSKYSFYFVSPTNTIDSIYLGHSQSLCSVPDTGSVVTTGLIKTMLRLPDTGEKTDYTSTPGEDADYTINPPYFIDHKDGTVTDTVTGLMWQKTDGGEMTWENALKYADTLTLAGYTDWRLPNIHEGFSILNEQYANPAIDTTVFTKNAADYWWSSTPQKNDSTKIWCTNAGGGVGNKPKIETLSAGGKFRYQARAVRVAHTTSTVATHFTNNGNGTITDNITGLIWQKVPYKDTLTWENALIYADSLTLAGITDWRLPNIKELQSLNDEKLMNPSIDTNYIKIGNNRKYWASTTLPNHTTEAWYINTSFGITTYDLKTAKDYVFCVSGKGMNALPVGIDFNAYKMGNKSSLNWSFPSILNNLLYIIERSENGLNWLTVDSIVNINNAIQIDYKYIDATPLNGINFYRIKMVSADGKIVYSSIKSLNFDTGGKGFIVYPNPAKEGITIELNSSIKSTDVRRILLIDLMGKVVFSKDVYQQNINTTNLTGGFYIVRIILNDNKIFNEKLEVVK